MIYVGNKSSPPGLMGKDKKIRILTRGSNENFIYN